MERLWSFLKVTLGIGPQASSLLLHPLQLLGEGEVVEIGFSSTPASFLQGFSAFSLYTLPGVRAGSQIYLFGPMSFRY